MTLAIYPKINDIGKCRNETKPPISPNEAANPYYSNVAIS